MPARNSGSCKALRLNPIRGVTLWPPAVFDLPENLLRDSTEPMQKFAMNFFFELPSLAALGVAQDASAGGTWGWHQDVDK